jgi:hypothetical protein
MQTFDRSRAKSSTDQSIECGRATATLNMSERYHPQVEAQPFLMLLEIAFQLMGAEHGSFGDDCNGVGNLGVVNGTDGSAWLTSF